MRTAIRRLEIGVAAVVLTVAAFSTGLPYLFYIVYLGILVAGGSYILTRYGLADLEAGYAVSRLTGHVGDEIRVTYTVRNVGRLPKPWLELFNPTDLPTGLPARAISLGGGRERSWLVRIPLAKRGTYRIEPLRIRTADPFGLFEASADVGDGVEVVVYPRVDPLPLWRLPAANLEGAHAAPERTMQTTPLATTVRPYAPGDSFNRIHWRSTARHGEIQVKEFELERTADVWVVLDMEAVAHGLAGPGAAAALVEEEIDEGLIGLHADERSTIEMAVRVAASIASAALEENRSVGMSMSSSHASLLPADRGGRQRLKVMQLLAAVDADGSAPLAELLVTTLPRLRQGMTVVIVTPSLDRSWVRPLGLLRGQGVSTVAILLDRLSFAEADGARHWPAIEVPEEERHAAADELRAMRHALAEYAIPLHVVPAGRALAEVLAS